MSQHSWALLLAACALGCVSAALAADIGGSMGTDAVEESARGAKFLEWAVERGAVAPKVEITSEPELGGYGVRAKRLIKKGEEIVRIPHSLVLNRGTLVRMFEEELTHEQSSQGAVDARANLIWGLQRMDSLSNRTNTEAHVLSFFILYNRAVPRLLNFQPWLNILPKEFHNPVHFDDDTVELLAGSDLYDWTKRLRTSTTEFWSSAVSPTVEVIANAMAEAGFAVDWSMEFSLSNWKWAMSVVSSRSTFIPNQGLSIALLADLFNHRPHQAARQPLRELAENGDLLIISQQTYGKGSQIFIDYGKMTSSDFLQLYGFIDEEADHESVPFWFTLHPTDPIVEQKRAFLTELGYRPQVVMPLTRRPSKELMFYLRLLTCHAGDFEKLKESPNDYFQQMLSPDNEVRALTHLIQVADSKRRKFPSDDKGDIILLEGDDLTLDERLAIAVRLRQKQTLLRLLSYATVARDAAAAKLAETETPKKEEALQKAQERLEQEAQVV